MPNHQPRTDARDRAHWSAYRAKQDGIRTDAQEFDLMCQYGRLDALELEASRRRLLSERLAESLK